jgi:hypothetical protein
MREEMVSLTNKFEDVLLVEDQPAEIAYLILWEEAKGGQGEKREQGTKSWT